MSDLGWCSAAASALVVGSDEHATRLFDFARRITDYAALPFSRFYNLVDARKRNGFLALSRLKKGFAWFAAILAVLVAVAFAIVYVQGRREPKGKPVYVALGSSFAAGAGLGALQAGSPTLCARSVDGYPQQLARMLGLLIVDMSCGGAVTRDVLRGGQFFQGPQIRVITPETRLVTMTAGGNDVGYIGDLSQLAARHTSTVFGRLVKLLWSGPKTPAARRYDVLRRELDATLRAIRAKAPGAVVIVATYPTILPQTGTCLRIGLDEDEAATMRTVGNDLAAVTRSVALRNGAVLVDMHVLGAAHDACSAVPWTRGWTNGSIAPFHPTLAGANATAQAIAAALAASPLSRRPPGR